MHDAKIQLSQDELMLVQNADWLLTKNKIIGKAISLFGDIAHHVRDHINEAPGALPPEALVISPKIFKGENYRGLPYVMLDYPRLFGKEDIFAIRCMFWWGNYFSVTWHLKGQYLSRYSETIRKHHSLLARQGFHVCIAGEEWRHEFAEDNYIPVSRLTATAFDNILSCKSFCKLSAKISLMQWNQSQADLIKLYQVLFRITDD